MYSRYEILVIYTTCKYFLPVYIIAYLFTFLIVFFDAPQFLILMKYNLPVFSFLADALGVTKDPQPSPKPKDLYLHFLLGV